MELFKLFGTIAVNNDEANQNIDETTEKAEGAESKMSAAFKKIGAAVAAAFAVDKIVAFGRSITDAAATVAAEQSAFEQIMGDYSDTAQEKVNEIADATGMVDTRLTPYMTSMTAKFKGLGYDIDDATTLASDGLTLAADAAAFWDKSLDDSMSALNSFINGSYEGGEAIGLFANDTQMAQYAIKTGLVDTTAAWSSLDEATKQATRLEYAKAMFEQSGATGQAAKEADQYANVQANLTEKWRQFKAQIGEPILQNIVLPAMDKLSGLVDKASAGFENAKVKVKQLTEWYKKNKTWVDLLAIAIGSIVTGMLVYQTYMGLVAAKAKLVAAAQALMDSSMLASPITWIVVGITALVAAFIYLWNNCEGFRNFWINLWEKIKTVFQAFIDWISPAIEAIKDFFVSLWEKIKEIASAIWEDVKPLIDSIVDAFVQAWELIMTIWDAVEPYFSKIWDGIKAVFAVVKTFFVTVFKNAWEKVKLVWSVAVSFFKTIWENIKLVFSVVKTYFAGMFSTAWEAIKAVWNNVIGYFTAIWDTIKGIFAVVKNVLSGNWKEAWESIKGIVNGWKDYFKGVWDSIKNVFGSVGEWFGNTFSAAWNAVKGVFSNWGSFFSGLWEKIKNTFSKIGTNIANAISGAVKAGINGVISAIEGIVNKGVNLINGAIKLINKIPGVSIGKLDKLTLPRLATGGVVDKPTIAQIGENGAEAIVPLEKNTGWMNEVAERLNALQSNTPANNDALIDKLDEMINAILNLKLCLNTGELVGGIASTMDSKLGDINRLRGRGR